MQLSRRSCLATLGALCCTSVLAPGLLPAADWQRQYPTLILGVVTEENEADRTVRYQPVRTYLQKALGAEIKWRVATDYAGIIEGVKAKKIDIAHFGPAAYAQCWMLTNGGVVPLVGEIDEHDTFGYHAVVIVKADSPYTSLQDLQGKTLAFADPNSTSGHQAPRYFLTEQGYDVDTFFKATPFSGSHENSVIGLLNGTFDAAATWWNSETYSNPQRMAMKGMIPPDQWRIIWQSPKLPASPWAVPASLPEDMRQDIADALLNMPTADPEAWKALTSGKVKAFRRVTHADYEPVVRMLQANQKQRRSSN